MIFKLKKHTKDLKQPNINVVPDFNQIIPPEVRLNIFSFLNRAKDLAKISEVCKQWNHDTSHEWSLWKKFDFKDRAERTRLVQAIKAFKTKNAEPKNKHRDLHFYILGTESEDRLNIFNAKAPPGMFVPENRIGQLIMRSLLFNNEDYYLYTRGFIDIPLKILNNPKLKNSIISLLVYVKSIEEVETYLKQIDANFTYPHLLFFIAKPTLCQVLLDCGLKSFTLEANASLLDLFTQVNQFKTIINQSDEKHRCVIS